MSIYSTATAYRRFAPKAKIQLNFPITIAYWSYYNSFLTSAQMETINLYYGNLDYIMLQEQGTTTNVFANVVATTNDTSYAHAAVSAFNNDPNYYSTQWKPIIGIFYGSGLENSSRRIYHGRSGNTNLSSVVRTFTTNLWNLGIGASPGGYLSPSTPNPFFMCNFAIWDTALDLTAVNQYCRGVSPLNIFPSSLACYYQLKYNYNQTAGKQYLGAIEDPNKPYGWFSYHHKDLAGPTVKRKTYSFLGSSQSPAINRSRHFNLFMV
jgi:hypothetical protein